MAEPQPKPPTRPPPILGIFGKTPNQHLSPESYNKAVNKKLQQGAKRFRDVDCPETLAKAEEKRKHEREQSRKRMKAYRARLKKLPEDDEKRRDLAVRAAASSHTYLIRKRRKESGATPLTQDETTVISGLLAFPQLLKV
ncbi:hypothetical protein MKEN_00534700 [Mycena kentingensis (nom. inval.)]|nr:hypothetical protein MKEN_00534700 [Mycena kentingensis (nom. inval.)]